MNIVIFLMAVIANSRQNHYITEKNTEWQISNNKMEIVISKKNGNITAILMKNENLLSTASSTFIMDNSEIDNGRIIETTTKDCYPIYAEIDFKKDYAGKSVEYRFVVDSLCLCWEIRIINKNDIVREVKADFSIPIIESMNCLFYPASNAPIRLKNLGKRIFRYRINMFIPMIILYNSSKDYGISIFASLELQKPSLVFSVDKENLVVSYEHLGLIAHKEAKAAIYIIPHEGDWRPGLNFLLDKYPEYFYPKVENTRVGEGWYYLGDPSDKEGRIKHLKQQNVKWVELHGHFPFYGLYVPESSNWGLISTSDEISLAAWKKGAGEFRNSLSNMYDLINLWHKYGIQVYVYFQAFEVWHQYAEKYFAEDIAEDESGNNLPAWKFCNLMNPDPKNKWGKHILDQAEDVINKYTKIDGIFFDRMDYLNYDFAHNDGISMIDNKPAYMLGFALEKINEKIFDIFHKNKKGIWGNGPTSIEVCKNLDGIMAEGGLRNLYKIQYLGLVRPIIYLPYDGQPEETEEKLKNTLVCGAFPAVTYGGKDCQRLDEKYRPLFELIKNRQWVLTKNPIEVPDGFMSNIFQTPDSDYLAVLISPGKSQLVPHPFEYDIPVVVNIPDANQIENVYLLSGDWTGTNRIDFRKSEGKIELTLPYHLASSLVYLTRKKRLEFVRRSAPILIKGQESNLVFEIKSADLKKGSTIRLDMPRAQMDMMIKGDTVSFSTVVPESIEGEIPIDIVYNDTKYHMTAWVVDPVSFWVVDPVSFSPIENIFLQYAADTIQFHFSNNSNETLTIYPADKFSDGQGKVKLPKEIILSGDETKTANFVIGSKTGGTLTVTVDAKGKKFQKTFFVKTRLYHDKNDLFFDNFEKGMKNWAIGGGNWNVSNGIVAGSGPAHFAFMKNNDWHDYAFEVTTRCLGSNDPTVDWLKSYIFFRLQDEKNFYRFGIHGDGSIIDLNKCINGTWIELGSTFFEPQKNKWYALRIEVKGTKILGYLNAEKVLEANDNTFSSGGIGIGVLEDGMRCDYRDVIVKPIASSQ